MSDQRKLSKEKKSVEESTRNMEDLTLNDHLIELEPKQSKRVGLKQTRNFTTPNLSSINCGNSLLTYNQTNLNNDLHETSDQTAHPDQNLLHPNTLNRPTPLSYHRNFNNIHNSSIEFYHLKLSKSKLKAVTRTSALLSGFAMVAMVELGLDYSSYFEALKENDASSQAIISNTNASLSLNATNTTLKTPYAVSTTSYNKYERYLIPEPILILYSLVTCLLVGVHMLALMISTCILPQIEASSFDQFEFEYQMHRHEHSFVNNANATSKNFSPVSPMMHTHGHHSNSGNVNYEMGVMFPYKKFHRFIELAWISSTVLGIFLFLVEIGLVCYIKFYPISFIAARTGAVVMIPILVLFVLFTITFYKRLADFKVNVTKQFLNQLDHNLQPLHEHVI